MRRVRDADDIELPPDPWDRSYEQDDEPPIPEQDPTPTDPKDSEFEPALRTATPVDDTGDELDISSAEDARRYAETVAALETVEQEDDSQRFLTYRNYIGAAALIVTDQYGAVPYDDLARATRELPGATRIQRRPMADLERKRAVRELRGAWAYEISMSPPSQLFALEVPDLVMIANHTAGVFAHYAIYKACRALGLALHAPIPDQHEEHLDQVDAQLLRRGLMPAPWTARCAKGGPPRSRGRAPHVFSDMPDRTAPCHNLWVPETSTMWPLVATALKTTRDRSREFENRLERWRHQNRSRRARRGQTQGRKRWVPYDVQNALYAGMRPTNLLDFVYRMRRRSSYLDDSSFLNNRIGMADAIAFNRDLLLFTRATLHVLETLIALAAADDFLERVQDDFARKTNPALLAWTFAGRRR
jgi:hypothetical protein